MKLCLIIFLFIILAFSSAKRSLFKKLKAESKFIKFQLFRFKENVSSEKLQEALEEKPLIMKKGWLKYVACDPSNKVSYLQFIKNPSYVHESPVRTINSAMASKYQDQWGSLYIPDPNSFFFYLSARKLYIVSARKNDMAETKAVLDFDPSKSQYITEIKDIGNFKEGYCIRLKMNFVISKINYAYVVCTSTPEEKNDWLQQLSFVKKTCIKSPLTSPPLTIVNTQSIIKLNPSHNSFTTEYSEKNPIITYAPPRESKWKILQDWSTCTLACGSGTQTLHRQCIHGSPEAAPCQGEEILTRPCNEQPCEEMESVSSTVAPAKMQMLPISERPQRYEVNQF